MYTLSAKIQNNTIDSSYSRIHRTSIDSSGSIGFLYDAYRDQVLDSFNINYQETSCPVKKIRRCEIIRGKKDQNPNIFEMVSIDDESRLSLLLNLTERKGVGAINDYLNQINQYTRLFCYTYVECIQKISDITKDIQKFINRQKSQKQATHIITEVAWGMDVAVVLQLPSISDTITEIDRVLERICNFLQCDYNTLPLNSDEQRILKRIIHTRVFSNTDEISRLPTLYDVCIYIQQNKNGIAKHPISYVLQPITWLYPQYTGQGATFIPLTKELNQRVQQYVLHITSETKRLPIFIKEYLSKQLSGCLKNELCKAQKACIDEEDKCTHEVERFSKLVIGIRNGQVKMSRIDEALTNNEQITMIKTIADLNQFLNDLADKGHFISDLDRQHFRYVNVAECAIDKTDNERTIERALITNADYDRILCSNDSLNKNDAEQLRQLRRDLVTELKINPNLRLIYADFSYSSHALQYMMRLPSSIYNIDNNKLKQNQISLSKANTSHPLPVETQSTTPRSAKVRFSDVPPTKNQTNTSLLTESKTSFSILKENETSATSTRKSQITNSQFTEPQTYASIQTKYPNSLLSPIEKQIPVSPSIKVPMTASVLPTTTETKTKTNDSIQTKYPNSLLSPIEKQIPVSPSIKVPKTASVLPTATQTKTKTNDSIQTKFPKSVLSPMENQIPVSSSIKVPMTTTVLPTTTETKTKTYFPPPPITETLIPASVPANQESSVPSSMLTNTPRLPSPLSRSNDDYESINILLLGETGVGKSTFINAFANYLTFDTLQQAEKSQPVVLIPVSFLITVGNNFDEYIVKFGDVDDSKNEDFEHPGQSVTQHCKSYEFNLNRDHGKKLCIIDTPGFGDTRGIDQDDYNMAHILDYIKNLSHLNAICFLLKPNESRLNIFFRSCLTQLFSLCGPNIAEKILFCFTNSRSTFYTPGNTAPLLKKMLTTLPMGDVPFKKDNTFCFDSESFRYLVSLRNKIAFSDRDKEEYEMSWTKSVTEANRLIRYIRNNLSAYRAINKR